MSTIYVVLDDNDIIRFKTEDVTAARDYALINTGNIYALESGTPVTVICCNDCHAHLRHGVCPNNCEDQ